MNKQTLYTELSIQIATLEAKVDKLLELAMRPMQVFNPNDFDIRSSNHKPIGIDTVEVSINPPQWTNESYTDYLKRIGQYNEVSSDNENFEDSYK